MNSLETKLRRIESKAKVATPGKWEPKTHIRTSHGDPSDEKNLKEVMDTLGMNQTELAEKSKLTQAAISQIISGHREPSLSSIVAILEVIPVKFERLLK